MRLKISRSALADLRGILDYYRELGVSSVGEEFVATILGKAQQLLIYPDLGRKVPEFDQAHIRELMYPPFRIVYLRFPEMIALVRVWRSERLLAMPEDGSV